VQFTGTVKILLAILLVAMVGYSLKFAVFTGVTPSTKYANIVAIGK
jgi:hypothetical protein